MRPMAWGMTAETVPATGAETTETVGLMATPLPIISLEKTGSVVSESWTSSPATGAATGVLSSAGAVVFLKRSNNPMSFSDQ